MEKVSVSTPPPGSPNLRPKDVSEIHSDSSDSTSHSAKHFTVAEQRNSNSSSVIESLEKPLNEMSPFTRALSTGAIDAVVKHAEIDKRFVVDRDDDASTKDIVPKIEPADSLKPKEVKSDVKSPQEVQKEQEELAAELVMDIYGKEKTVYTVGPSPWVFDSPADFQQTLTKDERFTISEDNTEKMIRNENFEVRHTNGESFEVKLVELSDRVKILQDKQREEIERINKCEGKLSGRQLEEIHRCEIDGRVYTVESLPKLVDVLKEQGLIATEDELAKLKKLNDTCTVQDSKGDDIEAKFLSLKETAEKREEEVKARERNVKDITKRIGRPGMCGNGTIGEEFVSFKVSGEKLGDDVNHGKVQLAESREKIAERVGGLDSEEAHRKFYEDLVENGTAKVGNRTVEILPLDKAEQGLQAEESELKDGISKLAVRDWKGYEGKEVQLWEKPNSFAAYTVDELVRASGKSAEDIAQIKPGETLKINNGTIDLTRPTLYDAAKVKTDGHKNRKENVAKYYESLTGIKIDFSKDVHVYEFRGELYVAEQPLSVQAFKDQGVTITEQELKDGNAEVVALADAQDKLEKNKKKREQSIENLVKELGREDLTDIERLPLNEGEKSLQEAVANKKEQLKTSAREVLGWEWEGKDMHKVGTALWRDFDSKNLKKDIKEDFDVNLTKNQLNSIERGESVTITYMVNSQAEKIVIQKLNLEQIGIELEERRRSYNDKIGKIADSFSDKNIRRNLEQKYDNLEEIHSAMLEMQKECTRDIKELETRHSENDAHSTLEGDVLHPYEVKVAGKDTEIRYYTSPKDAAEKLGTNNIANMKVGEDALAIDNEIKGEMIESVKYIGLDQRLKDLEEKYKKKEIEYYKPLIKEEVDKLGRDISGGQDFRTWDELIAFRIDGKVELAEEQDGVEERLKEHFGITDDTLAGKLDQLKTVGSMEFRGKKVEIIKLKEAVQGLQDEDQKIEKLAKEVGEGKYAYKVTLLNDTDPGIRFYESPTAMADDWGIPLDKRADLDKGKHSYDSGNLKLEVERLSSEDTIKELVKRKDFDYTKKEAESAIEDMIKKDWREKLKNGIVYETWNNGTHDYHVGNSTTAKAYFGEKVFKEVEKNSVRASILREGEVRWLAKKTDIYQYKDRICATEDPEVAKRILGVEDVKSCQIDRSDWDKDTVELYKTETQAFNQLQTLMEKDLGHKPEVIFAYEDQGNASKRAIALTREEIAEKLVPEERKKLSTDSLFNKKKKMLEALDAKAKPMTYKDALECYQQEYIERRSALLSADGTTIRDKDGNTIDITPLGLEERVQLLDKLVEERTDNIKGAHKFVFGKDIQSKNVGGFIVKYHDGSEKFYHADEFATLIQKLQGLRMKSQEIVQTATVAKLEKNEPKVGDEPYKLIDRGGKQIEVRRLGLEATEEKMRVAYIGKLANTIYYEGDPKGVEAKKINPLGGEGEISRLRKIARGYATEKIDPLLKDVYNETPDATAKPEDRCGYLVGKVFYTSKRFQQWALKEGISKTLAVGDPSFKHTTKSGVTYEIRRLGLERTEQELIKSQEKIHRRLEQLMRLPKTGKAYRTFRIVHETADNKGNWTRDHSTIDMADDKAALESRIKDTYFKDKGINIDGDLNDKLVGENVQYASKDGKMRVRVERIAENKACEELDREERKRIMEISDLQKRLGYKASDDISGGEDVSKWDRIFCYKIRVLDGEGNDHAQILQVAESPKKMAERLAARGIKDKDGGITNMKDMLSNIEDRDNKEEKYEFTAEAPGKDENKSEVTYIIEKAEIAEIKLKMKKNIVDAKGDIINQLSNYDHANPWNHKRIYAGNYKGWGENFCVAEVDGKLRFGESLSAIKKEFPGKEYKEISPYAAGQKLERLTKDHRARITLLESVYNEQRERVKQAFPEVDFDKEIGYRFGFLSAEVHYDFEYEGKRYIGASLTEAAGFFGVDRKQLEKLAELTEVDKDGYFTGSSGKIRRREVDSNTVEVALENRHQWAIDPIHMFKDAKGKIWFTDNEDLSSLPEFRNQSMVQVSKEGGIDIRNVVNPDPLDKPQIKLDLTDPTKKKTSDSGEDGDDPDEEQSKVPQPTSPLLDSWQLNPLTSGITVGAS